MNDSRRGYRARAKVVVDGAFVGPGSVPGSSSVPSPQPIALANADAARTWEGPLAWDSPRPPVNCTSSNTTSRSQPVRVVDGRPDECGSLARAAPGRVEPAPVDLRSNAGRPTSARDRPTDWPHSTRLPRMSYAPFIVAPPLTSCQTAYIVFVRFFAPLSDGRLDGWVVRRPSWTETD